MLEFHLSEIGLFGTARARDAQVRGLARFLPETESEPLDGAELLKIEVSAVRSGSRCSKPPTRRTRKAPRGVPSPRGWPPLDRRN